MSGQPKKSRLKRSENWIQEDKNLLFDLVCENIQIIESKGNSAEINVKKKSEWEQITNRFNSKFSNKYPPRTVEQVKLQWKRMKLSIKKESPSLYDDMKNGFQDTIPLYNNLREGNKKPKRSPAKPKSFFKKVRKCCVDLIMKHGRPALLLDDAAFRDLLKLIPMTDDEREKLTSVMIKEYMDDDDEWSCDDSFGDDGDDEDVGDDEFDDKTDEEMENVPLQSIVKREKEECSCPSRDAGTHEIGCLAITQDPWLYFEMSTTEEATCKLCNTLIQCSSLADLKVHLTIKHPAVVTEHFLNEDPFTEDRGRTQSNSNQTTNEQYVALVTIEENLPQNHPPSTAKGKKRKYPPSGVVTAGDDETIAMESFKSIDQFGVYIASLMKLLPVEKRIIYQEQFVQTLLREQAVAG